MIVATILVGVYVVLITLLLYTGRALDRMREQRDEAIHAHYEADLAWEKGQDELQEMYEGQLLTHQETIWKLEDKIASHDQNCLPDFSKSE